METIEQKLGDGDGPAIIMSRQATGRIAVQREGELVVLRICDSIIRLKHVDAIRVGQWLMAKGVEAKLLAGDGKKRIEV